MSLEIIKNRSEIPVDGVRLTEEQAINYQLKVINGWKDGNEV